MREAAETGDDAVMMLGPAVVRLAVHAGLEQLYLARLVGKVLRMLQRQIEEAPDIALDPQVMPGVERLPGEHPRQRIGGEGVAGVAKAVARKLIQQDQQGQRPLGRSDPVVKLAPGSSDMGVMKAAAEFGVEGVVPGEPFGGTGLFPEGDDG